ncbi:hypothetical protein DY000_02040993 [Brassica cretica]|uniref:Uncharacterized protein n=1 Tax=Brassica cretica TaxID=69181 RepID=A0ABQ7BM10_BRACR|nr:hypothetical protein DY000_02040993 [Brassica cretica]
MHDQDFLADSLLPFLMRMGLKWTEERSVSSPLIHPGLSFVEESSGSAMVASSWPGSMIRGASQTVINLNRANPSVNRVTELTHWIDPAEMAESPAPVTGGNSGGRRFTGGRRRRRTVAKDGGARQWTAARLRQTRFPAVARGRTSARRKIFRRL